MSDAKALAAQVPVLLPLRLTEEGAAELIAELREADVDASSATNKETEACSAHPTLASTRRCRRCDAPSCSLCDALGNDGRCGRCARRQHRSRRFFQIRVAVLLSVLAGVLVWAADDYLRRNRRTDWSRPLVVGLVLLQLTEVDADALATLHERVPALAAQLNRELTRYRGASAPRIEIVTHGPIDVSEAPPHLEEDGIIALTAHNFALRSYLGEVDERAKLDDDGLDVRIYLVLRNPASPERSFVEGMSQQGGWVGMVEVELGEGMVDFALFVVAHELFHTFGASDKYSKEGYTLVPDGLAEPDRVPLYPQRFTEVMARRRPLSPEREAWPDSLEELRVGLLTAREIGWVDPSP